MLLYQPPFLEIDDLTIFRDDKDPNTFYYLVVQPAIARVNGDPSFSAYAILPESGEIGDVKSIVDAGLSIEVCLQPRPGSLEKAKRIIASEWQREVRSLVPAPIAEGLVYLVLATAGEEPNPEDWFISSGIHPSLIGGNRAALVVNTDGEEAKRLMAALSEGVIAGTLFYDLRLLGIAPVFNARMRVSWQRIYHHFDQYEMTNFIISTEEINKTIDELRESSAIVLEIEELDPDVRDFASKTLLDELKSQVIERLFKPSVPPLSAAKKIENRIASGISRVLSAIIPGSHFKRQEVDELQLSETVIVLKERRVKKYPFYPQALLSTLIHQAVGREGMAKYLNWILLDNLPFRSERVDVTLGADTFNTANIESVKIDCSVRNLTTGKAAREMTLIFDKSKGLKSTFNFIRQKNEEYRFDYKATIFLNANMDNVLPSRLEIDWQQSNSPFIYFNAAEYFEPYEINIAIDDGSIFEHAHLVEVKIEARERTAKKPGQNSETAGLPFIISRTFLFNAESKENKIFSFISDRTIPLQFRMEVVYYLANAREFKTVFEDVRDDFLFIENPFENKWSVDLISSVDWMNTERVIADIRVWDVKRKDYITEKFRFTEDVQNAIFHCSSSLETPRQEVEVQFSVVGRDASVVRSAWLKNRGSILVVRDNVVPERRITATLKTGPDYLVEEVKKITVEFQYEDRKNSVGIVSPPLEFEGIGDAVEFVHPMPDFTVLAYLYRVRASNKGGRQYKTKWINSTAEKLDILLPEKLW